MIDSARYMDFINEYCIEEFDDPADFSDPTNVGLCYTELPYANGYYGDEDDDYVLQVSADITTGEVKTYINNELIKTESLDDYIEWFEDSGMEFTDWFPEVEDWNKVRRD